MQQKHYDLICIGGGSGGLATARRAAEYGAKVLVIEAKQLGGTCVNVGCVPKKIAWHAAQISELTHLAQDYGFAPLSPQLDYAYFVDKRDAFIKKLNGIYANGLKNAQIDCVQGYGKFIDHQTVAVGEQTFTAPHIVIAVGGEPAIPDIQGAELGGDSDDFFAWRKLPKRVAIAGSGYIAVEIAGVLNALGVETHLIVRKSRFLRQVDDDIYAILEKQMQADGVHIHVNSQISAVSDGGDSSDSTDSECELSLTLNTGETLVVDKLLWAIGRTPMTDSLGLQKTDVELSDNGNITIDNYQNTSQPGIYALGDITGQPTLTPTAIEAGRQLAERLFNHQAQAKADFTYVPTVIFSHPAIGTVGLSEHMAKSQYGEANVKVYQSTFNPLLRSMTENKVPTRMKMVCAGDEETVVGIHIIGDFADEIIQGFAVAVQLRARKADFDKTLAIHPTSGEELVTMR